MNYNAKKMHCPNDHPYDEANTYIAPGGTKRSCRACRQIYVAQYSKTHRQRLNERARKRYNKQRTTYRIMPVIDRIRSHTVAQPNGCHEWTGCINAYGYGIVGIKYKKYLAHRVAWELANGPIPDGLSVCHSCDNPPCVNLEHLWLGTHKENMADRDAKGRGKEHNAKLNCPAGHPFDEANTKIRSNGQRVCKTCSRESQRRYSKRNPEAVRDSKRRYRETARAKRVVNA